MLYEGIIKIIILAGFGVLAIAGCLRVCCSLATMGMRKDIRVKRI